MAEKVFFKGRKNVCVCVSVFFGVSIVVKWQVCQTLQTIMLNGKGDEAGFMHPYYKQHLVIDFNSQVQFLNTTSKTPQQLCCCVGCVSSACFYPNTDRSTYTTELQHVHYCLQGFRMTVPNQSDSDRCATARNPPGSSAPSPTECCSEWHSLCERVCPRLRRWVCERWKFQGFPRQQIPVMSVSIARETYTQVPHQLKWKDITIKHDSSTTRHFHARSGTQLKRWEKSC